MRGVPVALPVTFLAKTYRTCVGQDPRHLAQLDHAALGPALFNDRNDWELLALSSLTLRRSGFE